MGEIEQLLTGTQVARTPDRVLATILFTDIADSTRRAAEAGDATWRRLLVQHGELARLEVDRAAGRVVKSLGDGVLAAFAGPARAIACAQALVAGVADLGMSLRAGLHTGECEAIGDDLGGIAVHIGARVGALAKPGEILVTQTVVDLVAGSGLEFADRGDHKLRGVPGTWRLHEVTGQSDARRRPADPAHEYMTSTDRLTVRLAQHAPAAMRTLASLARRAVRGSPPRG